MINLKYSKSDCLSGLPGADCENNDMAEEAKNQDYLKDHHKNPGK